MTEPTHFHEPSPACTGSDCHGGSRSRIHVGRARRRSRPPQRWWPRLTAVAVETGEKALRSAPWARLVGQRALQRSVLAPRSSGSLESGSMMNPTTAQADHY